MAAAPPNPAQPPVPNVAPLEPRTLRQISPPMLTVLGDHAAPAQAFARWPQIPIALARLDPAAPQPLADPRFPPPEAFRRRPCAKPRRCDRPASETLHSTGAHPGG